MGFANGVSAMFVLAGCTNITAFRMRLDSLPRSTPKVRRGYDTSTCRCRIGGIQLNSLCSTLSHTRPSLTCGNSLHRFPPVFLICRNDITQLANVSFLQLWTNIGVD